MMDSTVAVQTKGFGFSFHAVRNVSMAACRSSTLRKTPRRILSRQFAKPAFHQVEPTRTGRDEVRRSADDDSASPALLMFVGAVVVHDQMQSRSPGEFAIQPAQKFKKLLMAMPRITLADHLTLEASSAANKVVVPLRT